MRVKFTIRVVKKDEKVAFWPLKFNNINKLIFSSHLNVIYCESENIKETFTQDHFVTFCHRLLLIYNLSTFLKTIYLTLD